MSKIGNNPLNFELIDNYEIHKLHTEGKATSLIDDLAEYCELYTKECDAFWKEKYNKALLKSQENYMSNKI